MKGAMKMINLIIGFGVGLLIPIILNCLIIPGDEIRKDGNI
jgi:hypothetical protein